MSVLERASAHFESRPVKEIEIAEWGQTVKMDGETIKATFQFRDNGALTRSTAP